MRKTCVWSDGARGSGAIKAHSDVIICQERIMKAGNETVYWGAFGKDEADIEPIALEESAAQSFYWQVAVDLPDCLRATHTALETAGGKFPNKKAAVEALVRTGVKQATAYRHLKDLENRGMFTEKQGEWVLGSAPPDMVGIDEGVSPWE